VPEVSAERLRGILVERAGAELQSAAQDTVTSATSIGLDFCREHARALAIAAGQDGDEDDDDSEDGPPPPPPQSDDEDASDDGGAASPPAVVLKDMGSVDVKTIAKVATELDVAVSADRARGAKGRRPPTRAKKAAKY